MYGKRGEAFRTRLSTAIAKWFLLHSLGESLSCAASTGKGDRQGSVTDILKAKHCGGKWGSGTEAQVAASTWHQYVKHFCGVENTVREPHLGHSLKVDAQW